MVIGCPKCKTKLKIPEDKLKPEGTKFKCPKCSAILKVKKPGEHKRAIDAAKAIVAHENVAALEKLMAAVSGAGYNVATAADGVDAMVKIVKDLPFVVVIDIGLPKIHGYEIALRLKARADSKDIKVVLVSSPYDSHRQKKMPPSLYGVDAYIDEGETEELLPSILSSFKDIGVKKEPEKAAPPPKIEAVVQPKKDETDERVERAKRLARTVLSDIDLYNPQKVVEAVKNNSFQTVFAEELYEGLKHYEKRIPPEVRNKGKFFEEALNNFLQNKKKALGI